MGDIEEAVNRIINQQLQGIYHVGGPEFLSRYEFAFQIAEVFGLPKEKIIPMTTQELGQKAPRPLKAGLIAKKLQHDLDLTFHHPREGLQKLFTETSNVHTP